MGRVRVQTWTGLRWIMRTCLWSSDLRPEGAGLPTPKVTRMVFLWLLPSRIRGERKLKKNFRFGKPAAAYGVEMNERRQDFELLQRFTRQGEQSAFADVVRPARGPGLRHGTSQSRGPRRGAGDRPECLHRPGPQGLAVCPRRFPSRLAAQDGAARIQILAARRNAPPPWQASRTPIRKCTTRMPHLRAGSVACSQAWQTSARKPVPGPLCSSRTSSPRSP